MSKTIDLTTDRAVHVAAFRHAYIVELGSATWWSDDTHPYMTTNVVAIAPVVTHFRAPLSGGQVEVMGLDGSWSPFPAHLSARFRYVGQDPATEFGSVYVIDYLKYDH